MLQASNPIDNLINNSISSSSNYQIKTSFAARSTSSELKGLWSGLMSLVSVNILLHQNFCDILLMISIEVSYISLVLLILFSIHASIIFQNGRNCL